MGNPLQLTGHKSYFPIDDCTERNNLPYLSVCFDLAIQKQYGRSTNGQILDNSDL
jgi:hypothetical protein